MEKERNAVKLEFRPTHKHAEGGNYQKLATVMVHVAENQWQQGVLYMDSKGNLYVRGQDNFNERFTEKHNGLP